MAFQIKDALSIVAGAVNHMRAVTSKITDFHVGSTARTLIEGPAVEIDELYQNMVRGVSEAIPAACYTAFGFARLPARAAVGRVTFSIPAAIGTDTVIPAGTILQRADGGASYATSASVTIPAGQTSVNASIAATTTGALGIAGANQVTVIQSAPPGVSVTNPSPISGGTAEETDDERADRFRQYVRDLSRGPIGTIEQAARDVTLYNDNGTTLERVVFARVLERSRVAEPPGFVDVYLYDGGAGASPALVSAVSQRLNGYTDSGQRIIGYKAAGIVIRVLAATIRTVDVTMTVKGALTAADVQTIKNQVAAYIDGVQVGTPAYRSEIITSVMGIPGVIDCNVAVPPGNIIPTISQKLLSGTINVTVIP